MPKNSRTHTHTQSSHARNAFIAEIRFHCNTSLELKPIKIEFVSLYLSITIFFLCPFFTIWNCLGFESNSLVYFFYLCSHSQHFYFVDSFSSFFFFFNLPRNFLITKVNNSIFVFYFSLLFFVRICNWNDLSFINFVLHKRVSMQCFYVRQYNIPYELFFLYNEYSVTAYARTVWHFMCEWRSYDIGATIELGALFSQTVRCLWRFGMCWTVGCMRREHMFACVVRVCVCVCGRVCKLCATMREQDNSMINWCEWEQNDKIGLNTYFFYCSNLQCVNERRELMGAEP